MSVYKILVKLAATNSRLEKEAILKAEHGNAELRETVRLALDTLTQFYIRKVPIVNAHAKQSMGLPWAFEQLKLLNKRKVTGNAAIEHLKNTLEALDEADSLVVERIISKDLRCGVSTSTATKIWPGLVAEFPCMLASQYDEKLIGKLKWPAYVQLKLDGMRASVVVENGAVTVYSRNGKIIDLGAAFAEQFLHEDYNDVVYDGELLVATSSGKIADRKTGNGILNKAVKGTISVAETHQVVMVLFDMIPLQDFRNGICIVPYDQRFDTLADFVTSKKSKRLSLVPTKAAENIEQAKRMFDETIAEGHEGIILKDARAPWEDKRSKFQIKFKAELDCDLLCVGVEEGTGKYKGKMGALVLESADGIIKTNVGTGFSDKDREDLWENKPVGKIVAVCYNARIVDKNTGVHSLFLPRFLEVREDKFVADSSDKIK